MKEIACIIRGGLLEIPGGGGGGGLREHNSFRFFKCILFLLDFGL